MDLNKDPAASPMKAAIAEALAGIDAKHGGPFGAVVVLDGKIIGKGHNKVLASNDPTAHGEVEAIRDACKNLGTFDLHGADLYTTCYPCPMCLGAILWARISKVYYCMSSQQAKALGFDDQLFYDIFDDKKRLETLLKAEPKELENCQGLFEKYALSRHDMY